MAIDLDKLRSFTHFTGLDPAELQTVAEVAFEKSIERNEMILFEGETSDALYLLVSGAVKAFMTSADGKEQIVYILRPGDSINDVPVFDRGPNPMSAQAMSPLVLYGLRSGDLEIILRDHPRVTNNFAHVLAEQVRQLMGLVEDLSFKHVINRVAKILLEYAGDGSATRPRLTQQEMAAMAGTAREMIGRSLKSLEDEGAIKLEHQRVVVTDREALEELAGIGA